MKHCLLIGGDNRQRLIADQLLKQGMQVFCYGMDGCVTLPKQAVITDKIVPAELVIFPIPMTRDGKNLFTQYASSPIPLDAILAELQADTIVCGGLIPDFVQRECKRRGIACFDYGKDEQFQLLNAVPSAEGAVEIALRNTPYILENAKTCVVGYGRIGKCLVKKLLGLQCRVTATARKETDLQAIQKAGATAVPTSQLAEHKAFDIIFNTVPAPVIDTSVLERQTTDTLIIDLASKPGGVDFDYAAKQGIHCIHALSLPAKCAPITAAESIITVIFNFLAETD